MPVMSYDWSFHSFDYDKFERALVHSRQRIADEVIGELKQFDDDPDRIQEYARVGKRLVELGFSYNGFAKRDLKRVDFFVFSLFHVCAEDIDHKPESPEFLSPRVTCELPSILQKRFFWSQPELIPAERIAYAYLPFFTHYGRRLGQEAPSYCEYIALNLEEARLLKGEIERYLQSPEGQKPDGFYDNSPRNGFLVPVAAAVSQGKA